MPGGTKLTDEVLNGLPSGSAAAATSERHKQWREHAGPLLDTVETFDVIDCAACGFRHIVPLPTDEELQQVYRHEYYTTDKPLYLEQYQEDADWWRMTYAERFDQFETLLPASRRAILDVGSGPGLFLAEGQQRGWQVLGIEPSAAAAEHALGLGVPVVADFLTKESSTDLGPFDVVHASNVLEHLSDPAEMLRVVHNVLRPGGVVCIVVPNDYNPLQLTLNDVEHYRRWWLAPPHHINYFDFVSLERLFERTGFEVLQRQTTFPMELFLLMGDNYIENGVLGRSCHAKRKRLEQSLSRGGLTALKAGLYRSLAEQGIGREVVLYGRAV